MLLTTLAAALTVALGATPPQATLLLGLDTDQSQFARESYRALYDDRTPPGPKGRNVPLQTLVVVRDGDVVHVETLPFLAIPAARGFRYMTLEVRETPNASFRAGDPKEEFPDPETRYRLSQSVTAPRLYDRIPDLRAELARRPSLEQALTVEYSSPRWITPRFYVSSGMQAEVTGGAAGFHASERSGIAPISEDLTVASDRLKPWIEPAGYRALVIAAANATYNAHGDKRWDPSEPLPWGPMVEELDGVAFSLEHRAGSLAFVALVPLNGNSSRTFLAREPLRTWPKPLGGALGLSPPSPASVDSALAGALDFFRSPDGSTLVAVFADQVKVFDATSRRLLHAIPRPAGLRAAVMAEWALGRFAAAWARQMHEANVAVGGP